MSDASETPAGETGLIYDPTFLLHDTGPGHPESPQRYTAVMEALEESDLPLRRLQWNPGTTLNLPVPRDSGGRVLIPLWRDSIGPALREFRPDFILISAGFDARVGDPVGMLNLKDEDFSALTRLVCGWADELCGGRVVSVLEGGYDPQGLAMAVIAHVQELVGARDQRG